MCPGNWIYHKTFIPDNDKYHDASGVRFNVHVHQGDIYYMITRWDHSPGFAACNENEVAMSFQVLTRTLTRALALALALALILTLTLSMSLPSLRSLNPNPNPSRTLTLTLQPEPARRPCRPVPPHREV